jgi:hypothetical protein
VPEVALEITDGKAKICGTEPAFRAAGLPFDTKAAQTI